MCMFTGVAVQYTCIAANYYEKFVIIMVFYFLYENANIPLRITNLYVFILWPRTYVLYTAQSQLACNRQFVMSACTHVSPRARTRRQKHRTHTKAEGHSCSTYRRVSSLYTAIHMWSRIITCRSACLYTVTIRSCAMPARVVMPLPCDVASVHRLYWTWIALWEDIRWKMELKKG